jgi:CheY-like chemotaxis protein
MRKPILQVEDSADDARLLQLAFQKAGVTNQIITVQDGEEALCYLNGEGACADRNRFPMPGVILLDLKLPGISGFDVLAWIKQQSSLKEILIVVISGHSEISQLNRAYSLGAHSFLTKPINGQDVANLTNAFKEHWTFDQHDQMPHTC